MPNSASNQRQWRKAFRRRFYDHGKATIKVRQRSEVRDRIIKISRISNSVRSGAAALLSDGIKSFTGDKRLAATTAGGAASACTGYPVRGWRTLKGQIAYRDMDNQNDVDSRQGRWPRATTIRSASALPLTPWLATQEKV